MHEQSFNESENLQRIVQKVSIDVLQCFHATTAFDINARQVNFYYSMTFFVFNETWNNVRTCGLNHWLAKVSRNTNNLSWVFFALFQSVKMFAGKLFKIEIDFLYWRWRDVLWGSKVEFVLSSLKLDRFASNVRFLINSKILLTALIKTSRVSSKLLFKIKPPFKTFNVSLILGKIQCGERWKSTAIRM